MFNLSITYWILLSINVSDLSHISKGALIRSWTVALVLRVWNTCLTPNSFSSFVKFNKGVAVSSNAVIGKALAITTLEK